MPASRAASVKRGGGGSRALPQGYRSQNRDAGIPHLGLSPVEARGGIRTGSGGEGVHIELIAGENLSGHTLTIGTVEGELYGMPQG